MSYIVKNVDYLCVFIVKYKDLINLGNQPLMKSSKFKMPIIERFQNQEK
jgi:hypothetical protein